MSAALLALICILTLIVGVALGVWLSLLDRKQATGKWRR